MGRLEEQIVLRLPDGTAERAERLAPAITDDPQYFAYGKIKKSMVLRLAVLEGLAVLEERYSSKRKKRSRK